MTPEEIRRKKALREAARIRDTLFGKQIVAKSRPASAGVDSQRLPHRSGRELRVLEGEDAGAFFFVPGYSMVGGPDIVP
ncbi:hypothetical protein EON81_17710 [bacterium]|nr:MAG: hypothetical protein EON81_17710 [bacterium]